MLESVVIVVLAAAAVLAALYLRRQRYWRARVSLLQRDYHASRAEVAKLEARIEALETLSLATGLPYDPRDVRLLGDPVGCVMFAGLHAEGRVEEVVFVEAGNGEAAPSQSRQTVRSAVEAGRVRYVVRPLPATEGGSGAPMQRPRDSLG